MKLLGMPHIHMIEQYNEHYCYDVNTNAIVKLSDELAEYLHEIIRTGECDLENIKLSQEAQEGLNYLLSQGLLHPLNDNVEIEHLETSVLENMYSDNLKGVILQVTQNCNLRCKYCVYSGSYVNRQHNNKRMTLDTAKAIIDFFGVTQVNQMMYPNLPKLLYIGSKPIPQTAYKINDCGSFFFTNICINDII